MSARVSLALGCLLGLSACASVGSVLQATVTPGYSIEAGVSMNAGPAALGHCLLNGEQGRSVSFFPGCELGLLAGLEGALVRGVQRSDQGSYSLAVGGGTVAGEVAPFVEVYRQLRRGSRAWGAGARIGLPLHEWSAHQLFARLDLPVPARGTLSWNPSLLLQRGRADSALTGSWLGLANGVGWTGDAATTATLADGAEFRDCHATSDGRTLRSELAHELVDQADASSLVDTGWVFLA